MHGVRAREKCQSCESHAQCVRVGSSEAVFSSAEAVLVLIYLIVGLLHHPSPAESLDNFIFPFQAAKQPQTVKLENLE